MEVGLGLVRTFVDFTLCSVCVYFVFGLVLNLCLSNVLLGFKQRLVCVLFQFGSCWVLVLSVFGSRLE